MPRYYTRFQARQVAAASKQEPVQPPTQTPHNCPQEDIEFMNKHLTIGESLSGMVNRIENSIKIFSYLGDHPSLLHYPRFRLVAIDKIADLRRQIEEETKKAIDTFINFYVPYDAQYNVQVLSTARVKLESMKRLETELKKVELILNK